MGARRARLDRRDVAHRGRRRRSRSRPSCPRDLAAWIAGRSYPELFAEAFGIADVTRGAHRDGDRELRAHAVLEPVAVRLADRRHRGAHAAGERRASSCSASCGCAGCHAGSLHVGQPVPLHRRAPGGRGLGAHASVTHSPADLGRVPHAEPAQRRRCARRSCTTGGSRRSRRWSTSTTAAATSTRRTRTPRIRPLNLTPQQKAQLVAFLRPAAHRSARRRAQTAPFDRPSLYSESALVPQVLGGRRRRAARACRRSRWRSSRRSRATRRSRSACTARSAAPRRCS